MTARLGTVGQSLRYPPYGHELGTFPNHWEGPQSSRPSTGCLVHIANPRVASAILLSRHTRSFGKNPISSLQPTCLVSALSGSRTQSPPTAPRGGFYTRERRGSPCLSHLSRHPQIGWTWSELRGHSCSSFHGDNAHQPHPQSPSPTVQPPTVLEAGMTEKVERGGSSSSGGSSPSRLFHPGKGDTTTVTLRVGPRH